MLAERRRLPLFTSLASLHLSCKYVGANPREIWHINTASLKSIRRLEGNQWSRLRTGEMCSRLPVRVSISVGAQSTLGGQDIFARKYMHEKLQNARILHDICAKN